MFSSENVFFFFLEQLSFFRKGVKALEAVDPLIRIVAEKHRIDCQLTEFDDVNGGEDGGMNSFERIDDGELSFDYGQKKQGLDNFGTSSNPMEVINLLLVITLKTVVMER